VRLRGLLEAADLSDIAQALPALAQPVQITPRKPVPAGRRSTVGLSNNGVDGSER
jgi:hypothetical protein